MSLSTPSPPHTLPKNPTIKNVGFFSFNSPTLSNYIHIRNQSTLVITISDMLINQTLVMLMNRMKHNFWLCKPMLNPNQH